MTDAPEAQSDPQTPSPYMRLPVPVVAAALFAFLALLLAVGLYANANWRRQGIILPTPASAAAPTTAPVAAAPTPAPSPTLQSAPVATPVPSATPTALASATTKLAQPTSEPAPGRTPLVLHLDTPAAVTAMPTPAPVASAAPAMPEPSPTIDPDLEQEVTDAYKNYWEVRAHALYELDPSHLPEVMAGEHLAAVVDRINELRSEGRVIQTQVDHNYVVLTATSENATIADSYTDRSIYRDLDTNDQLTTPTNQTLNELYVLHKTNGSWRVVDLVRSP